MSTPTFDVSIAAHYVPDRIPFLASVLHAMAEWARPSVSVTLVTNDLAMAREPLLIEAGERLARRGFTLGYDQTRNLAHPWHLTWWHKRHLREWFGRGGSPEDLFMYIEDDIVVSAENVAYFERALPGCKKAGCLPGFLRYETGPTGARISPDYRGYQAVAPQHRMTIDGQAFIAPTYSYWAGFILDRELCAEYLASPWSDLEAADALPQSRNHSCRVQSAWALTFENVPAGLPSRYVVPVDAAMRPLPECQVWHCANNYSRSKKYNFGTVPMSRIFQQPGLGVELRQRMWDAAALRRRATDKLARMLKLARA